MKKLYFLILSLVLLSFNGKGQGPGPAFVQEDLTFEICDSVFSVSGIYYLSSEKEGRHLMIYPFPGDSIYGKPFDINVTDLNTGNNIPTNAREDFSSVTFPAVISESTPLLISYKQHLRSNKARYILLTTHHWDKPLQVAEFRLVTSNELVITSFSIPPHRMITVEDKNMYFWQLSDFWPTTDFIVEFER